MENIQYENIMTINKTSIEIFQKVQFVFTKTLLAFMHKKTNIMHF